MLTIDSENRIKITRGDHAEIAVTILLEGGAEYEPASGDVLKLTVKKYASDADELITITAPAAEKRLVFDGAVMGKELPFGKYVYDLQLIMTDGKIHTVIPCTGFFLEKEVGSE